MADGERQTQASPGGNAARPPPWTQENWSNLVGRRRRERLPHALLLSGPAGLGKRRFAEALAAALLCREPHPDGSACGQCGGCRLFAGGSHPDFLRLVPEEGGRAIKIEQVRAHNEFLSLTAQYRGHRVSLIDPADAMTMGAANSLLKTLEEPSGGAVLLLVSDRPAALPATIRSRCQRIEFRLPAREQALAWLREETGAAEPGLLLDLAGGAPLAAAAMADGERLEQRSRLFADLDALWSGRDEPVAVAARWHGGPGLPEALHWLSLALMDMIRLKLSATDRHIMNRDQVAVMQRWVGRAAVLEIQRLLESVETYRRQVSGQANLNPQLVIEDLLIDWTHLSAGTDRR
ncbi:DNA polymerase III subunit delta' [Thioalbus denitrificans]|uniref:DNA polymerase III subunit delta' n=1 Tax=Thioalbus denitrificans TaxID=547122 RepID=A0A369CI56_9GAMM|nr:DNA polymerase III subunit delta' [Thioalbus denitrificans]RCX32137.1 DNA polymerase III delta prime subunit [Thioalbus denitrificans]